MQILRKGEKERKSEEKRKNERERKLRGRQRVGRAWENNTEESGIQSDTEFRGDRKRRENMSVRQREREKERDDYEKIIKNSKEKDRYRDQRRERGIEIKHVESDNLRGLWRVRSPEKVKGVRKERERGRRDHFEEVDRLVAVFAKICGNLKICK